MIKIKTVLYGIYYKRYEWGRYGGEAPVRKGRPQRSADEGEDFPLLLIYDLCSEEEQREENVYTTEQHYDVAEEVHELDFLEIVENDSY